MSEMEEGLISFKWNNHKSTFFNILTTLRSKETYSDAFLACEGKFFPVHKLVLSTCSDYFSEVFEKTNCKSPVIILKDIRQNDLEALLDYMYLGEVDVKQNELGEVLQAADCLRIKGLAVPDDESKNSSPMKSPPEHLDNPLTPPLKRMRTESERSESNKPIVTSPTCKNLKEPLSVSETRSLLEPIRPIYSILSPDADIKEETESKVGDISTNLNGLPSKSKKVCLKRRMKTRPKPIKLIRKTRKSSRNPILINEPVNSLSFAPNQKTFFFKHEEENAQEISHNEEIKPKHSSSPKYRKKTLDVKPPSYKDDNSPPKDKYLEANLKSTKCGRSPKKDKSSERLVNNTSVSEEIFKKEFPKKEIQAVKGKIIEDNNHEGSIASNINYNSNENSQLKYTKEVAGPSGQHKAKVKSRKRSESEQLKAEHFCNQIGLPKFSKAVIPYLEGLEVCRKEIAKLSVKMVDDLVYHLSENKMFIQMQDINMRSHFYYALQLKLLENYPNIVREESTRKHPRKGPLGILIGKLREKMNLQYRKLKQRLLEASIKNSSSLLPENSSTAEDEDDKINLGSLREKMEAEREYFDSEDQGNQPNNEIMDSLESALEFMDP